MNDTKHAYFLSAYVGEFHVVETVLSDGSCVYDVQGQSDHARATFSCEDKAAAEKLVDMLNGPEVGNVALEPL
jgi:hypothetical protein